MICMPKNARGMIGAVAGALLLAACATPFEARVKSFQAMPPARGQSFAVVPADPARAGSLEFQTYASLVSAELARQGFVPAGADAGADLLVQLDFGSGPPRDRLDTRPALASTWGWYGRGWHGRHPFWWNSFYDPFWGPWPQQEIVATTVYPAFVEVDILRSADKAPLFEGRAETVTRTNDLPGTMPNLVTALFKDFPGAPAGSRTVRVSA